MAAHYSYSMSLLMGVSYLWNEGTVRPAALSAIAAKGIVEHELRKTFKVEQGALAVNDYAFRAH